MSGVKVWQRRSQLIPSPLGPDPPLLLPLPINASLPTTETLLPPFPSLCSEWGLTCLCQQLGDWMQHFRQLLWHLLLAQGLLCWQRHEIGLCSEFSFHPCYDLDPSLESLSIHRRRF